MLYYYASVSRPSPEGSLKKVKLVFSALDCGLFRRGRVTPLGYVTVAVPTGSTVAGT